MHTLRLTLALVSAFLLSGCYAKACLDYSTDSGPVCAKASLDRETPDEEPAPGS